MPSSPPLLFFSSIHSISCLVVSFPFRFVSFRFDHQLILDRSIDRLINQSINKPTNQPINQSINLLVITGRSAAGGATLAAAPGQRPPLRPRPLRAPRVPRHFRAPRLRRRRLRRPRLRTAPRHGSHHHRYSRCRVDHCCCGGGGGDRWAQPLLLPPSTRREQAVARARRSRGVNSFQRICESFVRAH